MVSKCSWKNVKNDRLKKQWINPKTGDTIHVVKTSLVKEWEVGSNKKINPSSSNPRFKFFKSTNRAKNKSDALKFARASMKRIC